MSKGDILFAFPPSPGHAGVFEGHLGVAYLRAALAENGLTTSQYLSKHPGTVDAIAADILAKKCPIIGFTVYDANARLSIAIARSIKRQQQRACVIFGGPAATFNAQLLMERHPAIDACVLGEAEDTAGEIFTRLLDGRALDDTQKGVAFRRDGRVICTTLPPLVGTTKPTKEGTLDVTPSPYLSGILADGQLGVLTGRGCTQHCQYCCFAALGRMCLRLHSIERVVAELEYIEAHQKRVHERYPIAIQDDTFTLLPQRAKALCRAIADRRVNLALTCITRADTVDEELISLMRDAGFRSIAFGLESAVPSVLRAAGKVRPPNWPDEDLAPEKEFVGRVRDSVQLAKKYGFTVGVSIILGLPTETLADGAKTLRFVKKLDVDNYTHNFLWIFQGTPLWATHDKYGVSCSLDRAGLPITTGHSYDLTTVRPTSKCELEREVHLHRLLATDLLYGCAPPSRVQGINAAIIRSGELSTETAEWLCRTLAVGGLIVQVYPAMTRAARSLKLAWDRAVLNDCIVPAQYYIQLAPTRNKKRGDESLDIVGPLADIYRVHKPGLLAIKTAKDASPLIAWTRGQQSKATVCEISKYLEEPRELVHLMEHIQRRRTASLLRGMPIPPNVKYPCRWLPGRVQCSSLSRIEISNRGEVRCCSQSERIGRIGDSLQALSKQMVQLATAVEKRRGCEKCLNRHCPRCPFPGIDDRTYCHIMARQGRAQRALSWVWSYSRIPILVEKQRSI